VLTRAQGRKQRQEIFRQIAREHRRQQREELVHLRQELRDARLSRRTALRQAKEKCRADRLAAGARVRELRLRLLRELRDAVQGERSRAAAECSRGLAEARSLSGKVQRARAELEAERRYRRQMRRIEAGNRARLREAKRGTGAERRAESDEEVAQNIPPELAGLWQRVKSQIRGSDRMSRTEAFLHWAEEHPGSVLEAMEDRTEEVIRELERREREARRALKRAVPRKVLEEAPF
jgi:hypothetical protein